MSTPIQVDPRGLRVSAGITASVLAVVLIAPSPVREVLLGIQVAIFAIGAFISVQKSPYAVFFAKAVRPRLSPPTDTEDSRPPTFAQLVGFGFAATALIGFAASAPLVGFIATAFALVAALLNATTGFCLGCEMYLALRRFAPVRA